MLTIPRILTLLMVSLLAACINMPSGPSVLTLPGAGKSFEQFRFDDFECRQFAYQQVGGTTAKQASIASGIESAAVSTALGAAAGAAFGGGRGAAIGAGSGLLVGGLAGSSTAGTSGYANQERYDMSYIQCMYAKGHLVPVSGGITSSPAASRSGDSRISAPPPPHGSPPPAPPQ